MDFDKLRRYLCAMPNPPADITDLDAAHAAMEAAPGDDALRLRFHERLADSELFLLLTRDPVGDDVDPQMFDAEGQQFVLIFDREARLADFAGRVAPTVTLPGRGLVRMLAGQGIGMALNLGVAPSATLIPAKAVDWLAQTLNHAPIAAAARPVAFHVPKGLPEALIVGLDRKLATAGGLAQTAWLVGVTYDDHSRGHMLAFVGALPEAEAALAAAAGEALTFSGIEAGAMDVTFIASGHPVLDQLGRVGLRFDLPEPSAPSAPLTPGSDPAKPPNLR